MTTVCRKGHLAKKIVFVDGLCGCGKTLISQLIAGMDRVELLSYVYELEYICALYYLGKLSKDGAIAMVSLQTDLKIYNIMMGRDVNFRFSDLSSAYSSPNPGRYFQRLFGPGDEDTLALMRQNEPILNLATHNLLSYSAPIVMALGERCVFIEVVRHPLYMMRQQVLNEKNLTGRVRDFNIYYEYEQTCVPYYVHGWESEFANANPFERFVLMIEKLTNRTERIKRELVEKYHARILTVPFEPLVLDPDPWLQRIAGLLDTQISDATRKVMREQNVPRTRVAQGIDLEIYRRCGWVPPDGESSERDELTLRRDDLKNEVSNELMAIFDGLCEQYEATYWRP